MEPHDLRAAGHALYAFHSGAPSAERVRARARRAARAARRDGSRARRRRRCALEPSERPAAPAAGEPAAARRRLRRGAGRGRGARSRGSSRSTPTSTSTAGLIPFRERFPERFVECGIAEQDMVSQAGALALAGLLPAVHSFACFLTPRAERADLQQRDRGHEGHLRRLARRARPGRPGPLAPVGARHRAAWARARAWRCIEPATRGRGARARATGRCDEAPGPVYLRLVSRAVGARLRAAARPSALVPGRGTVVRDGGDALLRRTGPVMLSQAWRGGRALAADGVEFGVVALPWLRDVDGAWLREVAGGAPLFVPRQPLRRAAARATPCAPRSRRPGRTPVHKLGVDRRARRAARTTRCCARTGSTRELAERVQRGSGRPSS